MQERTRGRGDLEVSAVGYGDMGPGSGHGPATAGQRAIALGRAAVDVLRRPRRVDGA